MATRRRRTRAPARRRVSSGRSGYRSTRRVRTAGRVRSRGRSGSAQTLRIVIEQPSAPRIGADMIGMKPDPAVNKKAKF